jgi:hypothetical protein
MAGEGCSGESQNPRKSSLSPQPAWRRIIKLPFSMPPVAVELLKMTPDLPRPATKENLAAPDRDLVRICRLKDMKTEMPAR